MNSIDLPPDARRKLVGCLGMLGSDHAGERDAAARLANSIVRGAGLTWDALVASPRVEPRREPPPDASSMGWRDLALRAATHGRWLTDWERTFLSGLPCRSYLSPKQGMILDRIVLELRGRGVRV